MGNVQRTLELLGQPYVFSILSALYESPKRFSDLAPACKNERTRTEKIRRLEEAGLIASTTSKIKRKTIVLYAPTERGKEIFEKVQKIDE
ncbi:MAG: helix-turn-helix transcriptional regulator [Candidatus Aenigmarchaeota archaeon]|nr:helix-turn-helix transcriptional regulator [Candidatus Aenigmarchaeota archaeon]